MMRSHVRKSSDEVRYVKRTASGRFKESDDVSKSLSQDRRRKAKRSVKSGHGDQSDRRRSGSKKK